MALPPRVRVAIGILTGLWVTVGAAVPIGYVTLRILRSANGGELGPELLARPGVVLSLVAGHGVAASIGGWAAGWVAIERRFLVAALLSLAHAGTWLFVALSGTAPGGRPIALALGASAVVGTIAGVTTRAWQVDRRSRTPAAG